MKKMFLNYEMSMKTSNAYVVPRMIVIDVDVKSLIATSPNDPGYGVEGGNPNGNNGKNDEGDLPPVGGNVKGWQLEW